MVVFPTPPFWFRTLTIMNRFFWLICLNHYLSKKTNNANMKQEKVKKACFEMFYMALSSKAGRTRHACVRLTFRDTTEGAAAVRSHDDS
jgi:hypothetical protein